VKVSRQESPPSRLSSHSSSLIVIQYKKHNEDKCIDSRMARDVGTRFLRMGGTIDIVYE
jgi:hypothetical protein